MELFPVINPPSNIDEITSALELKDYYEVAWDFEKDEPIIENGDFKIVEGDEAIKIWAYKAIKTNRFEHSIYTRDYGSEINVLFGQNYTKELTKTEAERFIKEALIINPYILDVKVENISFEREVLTASVNITTIYNKEGEGVILNV